MFIIERGIILAGADFGKTTVARPLVKDALNLLVVEPEKSVRQHMKEITIETTHFILPDTPLSGKENRRERRIRERSGAK